MSEEEKQEQQEQPAPKAEEQNNQEGAEEASEPVNDEPKQEEVDERGVSYRNVAAEYQRKFERSAEELEALKAEVASLKNTLPKPKAPEPQKQPDLSDPDKYIAYKVQEAQKQLVHQQKLADAEALIQQKFGASRLQYGVQKVLDYAKENMIDVATDPVRAVTKILNDIEKPKKQLSAEDRKKTQEAIKNKPESGKRPPAPPVNNKPAIDENLRTRGTRDDAAAWLIERFKEKK
jgi:hypothetical protein